MLHRGIQSGLLLDRIVEQEEPVGPWIFADGFESGDVSGWWSGG